MHKDLEQLKTENADLRASFKETYRFATNLSTTFKQLLEEHLELRNRCGLEDHNRDCEYSWLERGGLLDD
jgi:tryptophan 2,3-dioxygenase